MRPDERDLDILIDMLEAAQQAQTALRGVDWPEYAANLTLMTVVERRLDILQEAAQCVSEGLRAAHPEIPWPALAELRAAMAREVGEELHERLYRVSNGMLPELIRNLEALTSL
jgi:uncharacterized protein with HEPN domain